MRGPDRTVHADMADGSVIVRYDRAGRWYREWPPEQGKPRQALTIAHAAQLAKAEATTIHFGRLGGSAFDRRVR